MTRVAGPGASRCFAGCRRCGRIAARVTGIALLTGWIVFQAPAASVRAESGLDAPPTGRWLVDRARTFALAREGLPTVTDAEYVLVWMRAAERLSPELPDAYLWQFDLLRRLDRPGEALAALDAYCRLVPGDSAARLNYISLGFEECQTVDARLAFCRSQLERTALAPEVVSDLHRRMADLYRRSGAPDLAREHARQAVTAFAQNIQARSLLLELEGRREDPAERTRLLLDAVAANPACGGAMWELARWLDRLSLHEAAADIYLQAIRDFKRRHPGRRPPPDVMLDLARSYCDGGRYDAAFETCDRVIQADPNLLDAQMLMIRIARVRGMKAVADQRRDALAARLPEMEPAVLANRDAAGAARLAWFYIEYKRDPPRAVRLARFATENASHDPVTRRLLGWAKLIDGDSTAAAEILEPLAATDPLAAVGLAKALLQEGRQAEAVAILRSAEALCYSGLGYEKAVDLLHELGQAPAPKPDRRLVTKVLEAFDESVLRFDDDPGKVVQLEVTFARTKFRYNQPWLCTLTLTNMGPYPITLGQDGMIANPQVLVSATGLWTNGPRFANYLSVSLMPKTILLPGERVVVRETLDVGPLGLLLEQEPQRHATFRLSFLLDPLPDDEGGWTSRLKNIEPVSVKITRAQVDATPNGVKKILGAARGEQESERIRAVHTLAALIAERRRALADHIPYTAHSVDGAVLRTALLATLQDPSPIVRAHTLDALRRVELDQPAIDAAAPLLSDANWLVRLLAIDLFASAQGPVFDKVANHYANADPDPLVKKLASLYHEYWERQNAGTPKGKKR